MALTNKERDEAEREGLVAFGSALGLDEQFVSDAAVRGVPAILDRLRALGDDGQQMRLVAMAQQLGTFLQRKVELGEQVKPGVVSDAIRALSKVHKIDEQDGLMLIGAALEVMQHTARSLALGGKGEDDGTVRRTP